jgi:hypothetical protein
MSGIKGAQRQDFDVGEIGGLNPAPGFHFSLLILREPGGFFLERWLMLRRLL